MTTPLSRHNPLRAHARAYTSEEAREQALGLAYHYEQVADALETEKES